VAERIIHIEWEGPYLLQQLASFKDPSKDIGLYQIYAHHPVYGNNVLVYIGKVSGARQSFATRISQHGWGAGSEPDRERVVVYLGRLKGQITPGKDEWNREIDLAEKLLIHAHAPAFNSTHIMAVSEGPGISPEVQNVRVLNWKSHRSLHREVSGLVWTKAGQTFSEFKTYGA
jgi:hypothetical protein